MTTRLVYLYEIGAKELLRMLMTDIQFIFNEPLLSYVIAMESPLGSVLTNLSQKQTKPIGSM